MQEYENILKTLQRIKRQVRKALQTVQSLEDKMRFASTERRMNQAISLLRLNYYEIQDVEALVGLTEE